MKRRKRNELWLAQWREVKTEKNWRQTQLRRWVYDLIQRKNKTKEELGNERRINKGGGNDMKARKEREADTRMAIRRFDIEEKKYDRVTGKRMEA